MSVKSNPADDGEGIEEVRAVLRDLWNWDWLSATRGITVARAASTANGIAWKFFGFYRNRFFSRELEITWVYVESTGSRQEAGLSRRKSSYIQTSIHVG